MALHSNVPLVSNSIGSSTSMERPSATALEAFVVAEVVSVDVETSQDSMAWADVPAPLLLLLLLLFDWFPFLLGRLARFAGLLKQRLQEWCPSGWTGHFPWSFKLWAWKFVFRLPLKGCEFDLAAGKWPLLLRPLERLCRRCSIAFLTALVRVG